MVCGTVKGKLIEFSAVTEEWITQFDSDGELLSFLMKMCICYRRS